MGGGGTLRSKCKLRPSPTTDARWGGGAERRKGRQEQTVGRVLRNASADSTRTAPPRATGLFARRSTEARRALCLRLQSQTPTGPLVPSVVGFPRTRFPWGQISQISLSSSTSLTCPPNPVPIPTPHDVWGTRSSEMWLLLGFSHSFSRHLLQAEQWAGSGAVQSSSSRSPWPGQDRLQGT